MGLLCQTTVYLLFTCSFLWETRGFGFGGGGGFSFPSPPLGPVFLIPVNDSTRWADIMEDTVLQALDHCKSVRLCNASGLDTFFDSECSECHPCSCTDTCYLRGDCCVDKLLRDVSDQLVLDTEPMDGPTVGCHSTYITGQDNPEYVFMTDRCPNSFQDKQIAEKCLNPTPNDTYSQWPVWSPATTTVYQNAHCALCHSEDVDQLEQWNLKIECQRSVELGKLDNADHVIREAMKEATCRVSFTAPRGSQAYACRPAQGDIIDQCNVTGWRMTHDLALWRACQVFQGRVTFDRYTYKNVFCAMCNNDVLNAPGTCEGAVPLAFFVELNGSTFPSALDRTDRSEESCQCQDSEVFDKYQRKCRQLSCSMTRTLIDRQCLTAVTNSTGLFYDVAIRLTPGNPQQPVQLKDRSSLKQVARNVRTSFMLQGSTSSGWDVRTSRFRVIARTEKVQSYSHGNNASDSTQGSLRVVDFKVDIRFCSMWPEPSETLETRLFALTNSLWNISVDGRPKHTFTASPVYTRHTTDNASTVFHQVTLLSSQGNISDFVVDIPDPYIQGYGAEMLQTDYYLPLLKTLKCPRVSFNLSDQDDSGDFVIRVNKTSGAVHHLPSNKLISFQFVEQGSEDGQVFICADQVFDTVDSLMSPVVLYDNVLSVEEFVMSVISQALSVVCLFLVIVMYVLYPELRTLSGKNTFGLVCTMLLAFLMFGLGRMGDMNPSMMCLVLGIIGHFFLLSALTWVVICMIHPFRMVKGMLDFHLNEREGSSKIHVKYVAVSLISPVVIIVLIVLGNVAASAQSSDCVSNFGYGNGICFLSNRWSIVLGAILPILIVLVLTFVLYCRAARYLSRIAGERKNSYRHHYKRLRVYCAVSTLTGVTWLAGMLGLLLAMQAFNFLFALLTYLLALVLTIVFVCKGKVLKSCRARFFPCSLKNRRLKTEHKFSPVET